VLIQENQPSIILIDEPEISLHLAWQKTMTDIDIENYPLDGEFILLDKITCYVEGKRKDYISIAFYLTLCN